jgi:hypothetical protein
VKPCRKSPVYAQTVHHMPELSPVYIHIARQVDEYPFSICRYTRERRVPNNRVRPK